MATDVAATATASLSVLVGAYSSSVSNTILVSSCFITFCYIVTIQQGIFTMATAKPLIERIPKRMLKALAARRMKNAEAAETLGVSETYLSRVVATLQEKAPGKSTANRQAASKLYRTRIEFRDKLAKQVMYQRMTLTQACKEAKCTERTMFRHVAKYRAAQAAKGPKAKKAT